MKKNYLFTRTRPVIVYETANLLIEAESQEEAKALLEAEIKSIEQKKRKGIHEELSFKKTNVRLDTSSVSPAYGTAPYYTDEWGNLLNG